MMTNHTLRRLLELAQDVVDRCNPLVPSWPLVALSDAASDLDQAYDAPELDQLADAVVAVCNGWRFWPPQEFGSSLAQGPDMSAIAELQEAIIAASAWLEEQPE